jgi:hypothetical protein
MTCCRRGLQTDRLCCSAGPVSGAHFRSVDQTSGFSASACQCALVLGDRSSQPAWACCRGHFQKGSSHHSQTLRHLTFDHALEHYCVREVAELWGLSERTIRRIFADEPGVIKWENGETRFKRGYTTLRIPESVVQRVHRKLRKAG